MSTKTSPSQTSSWGKLFPSNIRCSIHLGCFPLHCFVFFEKNYVPMQRWENGHKFTFYASVASIVIHFSVRRVAPASFHCHSLLMMTLGALQVL